MSNYSKGSTAKYRSALASWVDQTASRYSAYQPLFDGLRSSLNGSLSDMQLYNIAEGMWNYVSTHEQAKEPVKYYLPIKEGNTFRYVDFSHLLRNPEKYRNQIVMENLGGGRQAFIVGQKEMLPTFFGRAELSEPIKTNRFDPDVRF